MIRKQDSDPPVALPTGKTITGTLVWYYAVCKREVWLMGHGVLPDESDASLDKGRAVHESSFRRMEKEIQMEGMKIDLIDSASGEVCEVKSTSRTIKAARLQLAYYLYRLRLMGVYKNGAILVPKEKKRVPIILGSDLMDELGAALKGIVEICMLPVPPRAVKIPYCKKCAYRFFCWEML